MSQCIKTGLSIIFEDALLDDKQPAVWRPRVKQRWGRRTPYTTLHCRLRLSLRLTARKQYLPPSHHLLQVPLVPHPLSLSFPVTVPTNNTARERRGEERRGEVDCNKCAEAGWPGPRSMLRPQSLSQRGLMVVATNTSLAASTCPALIQWNICWNKSSHDNENLNLLGWTPATREASSSTPSQTGLWTIFIPRTSLFRHVTDCGGRNKQKNILLKNTEKQWDFSDVWKVSHLYSCWWHQARSHERAKSPLSFFTISLTVANMTRSVQNGPVCDW